MKKVLLEALCLIVVATAIALGSNYIRRDKLTLFGTDCLKQTRVCHSRVQRTGRVTIEEAAAFFFKNAAIFVDARSRVSYVLGHIPNAMNIPADDIQSGIDNLLVGLSDDIMIIVYDDDVEGNVSADVAAFLEDMGFKKVFVFPNGWSDWQAEGLPVELGLPGSG
ncbi:MAG: rhodanese-like domain-containing protein [Deltaproteobacteria bacterium]|nr:rhodanese-like domain-containing protein [Deltaproteobacteria bacterium]MBW2069506.1 rhodanese-like domain-containing protein [Deltaproteobacteria bacterium]